MSVSSPCRFLPVGSSCHDQNIVQAVVSAGVSSWWFTPEGRLGMGLSVPISSPDIYRTLLRCLTSSFGSICVASLAIPPAQLWKFFCACCQKHPVLGLRSSNRWSVPYIGLYAYPFSQAGERALQLFEIREWVPLVTENLTAHALGSHCLVIAGSSGTFGVLISQLERFTLHNHQTPTVAAFV